MKEIKLKDLKPLFGGKVVLYVGERVECDDFFFKDIYVGDVEKIPDDLLEKEVISILAKRTGILDVNIEK